MKSWCLAKTPRGPNFMGVTSYTTPVYVIDFTGALNFGEAVRPEKVDMFSRIGGRPTGIKVRSPLAWAASAEDNKVDEAD
jgi:hypothetical protein